MHNKLNISWDMETSDPDDVFTLCFLATHPRINLRSVTITPGSRHQVGVVKHILRKLDSKDVRVGAARPNHPKECVSEFHYKWLGKIPPEDADDTGLEIIADAYLPTNYKIVTGAALGNVGALLSNFALYKNFQHKLDEIVVQGGFAGDSVVPEEYRLEKFRGRETCPTFNLNGNIEAAKQVIDSKVFGIKRFVSKNVCHGIVYDQAMHERIKPHRHNSAGLNLLVEGMDVYLKNKPEGKAFHDPLAACVAISSDCCEFREVEIYREKGEWGSRLKEGTNTFISVKCNRERFEDVLVGKE